MKPSAVRSVLLQLVPLGETILLVGSPGVGKTDTVVQLAQELDYDLLVSHPVVDDPTDYKGMPSVVRDEHGGAEARFLPFGDLKNLITANRPTIAFADDLGQAPPAVQAAYMQLVLARKINGHMISPHVRFLGATNRRQDQAAVTGLITPLLDRFTTVLSFDFDLEDWIKWVLQNKLPDVLTAFARYRPEHVSKFVANRDMKKSATPRSIAGVGRLLKLGIEDVEVLSGAAGEAFATEFLAFYTTYKDIPDREEIYRNPKGVDVPPPDRPDIMYAIMSSVAYGMNQQNVQNALVYVDRCPPEYAALCVRDAIQRDPELKKAGALAKWAYDHRDVFGFD